MRALTGGVGPEWELRQIDSPQLQIGAARIQVMAAALNRADLYALEGSYRANGQEGDVYRRAWRSPASWRSAARSRRTFLWAPVSWG